MKLISLLGLLALTATAFAGEVELKPGTKVTLKANEDITVSCAAKEDESIPKCDVRRYGDSSFVLSWGTHLVHIFPTLDEALNAAKKSKDIGLCR